jgi:hypothetical protein
MKNGEDRLVETSEGPKARPAILVVPNGVTPNGDPCFHVQITPAPAEDDDFQIPLLKWPETIRKLAATLSLHVADMPGKDRVGAVRPVAGGYRLAQNWSDAAAQGADALWASTFPPDVAADLLKARTQDSHPQAFSANATAPLIDSRALADKLRDSYKSRLTTSVAMVGKLQAMGAAEPLSLEDWIAPGSARDEVGALFDEVRQRERDKKFDVTKQNFIKSLGAHTSNLNPLFKGKGPDSLANLMARYRAARLNGKMTPTDHKFIGTMRAAFADDPHVHLDEMALVIRLFQGDPYDKPPVDPRPCPLDKPRRKLASILASPTIASYLGMGLDIVVPRQQWHSATGGTHYGAVCATLNGAHLGAKDEWTAFVDHGPLAPNYFGPCDQVEAHAADPVAQLGEVEIVGGVVNLRMVRGGQSRFSLEVIDPVHSANRMAEYSLIRMQNLRKGETLGAQPPNPVGRSLALLDHDVHESAANEADRERDRALSTMVNYAGDLLRGYHAMVAIPRPGTSGATTDPHRWRTLMARTVAFPANQIAPDFVAAAIDEREFGLVHRIQGHQAGTDEDGNPKENILLSQEMFAWTGGSLAVALPTETLPAEAEIDADWDLAVPLTYDLPPEPDPSTLDYRPAPLREGYGYLVGLSASFVGGCGLSMSQSAAVHAADRYGHVLGDGASPFIFRRPDKIPAPVVLLPADSDMVTVTRAKDLHNETATTLVIRTGDGRFVRTSCQRFLFPHGVDFDRAEQQDQFRGVTADHPPGAFSDKIGVTWQDGGGAFPRAVDGDIVTDSDTKDPGRGLVLEFRGQANHPARPYYPDGNSQAVRTYFRPVVPSNARMPAMRPPTPFWEDGQPPRQAMPVMLEIVRAPADPAADRITRRDDGWTWVETDGAPVRVRRISIALQPATEVSLLTVCETDHTKLVKRHLIGEALIEHVRGGKPGLAKADDAATAAALLEALLANDFLPLLNGHAPLRLVHAQQRPDPPKLVGTGLGLFAVATTAAVDPKKPGQTWLDVVTKRIAAHNHDYALWESDEGGTTCFLIGKIDLDGPATGSLWFEALWDEHGPEYLKVTQVGSGYRYTYAAARNHTRFDGPPIDAASKPAALNLIGDSAHPNYCAHAFLDGRARRLIVTAVAKSRFADFFDSDAPGLCESRSDPVEVWVPCTFLPDTPTVDRITPVFDYEVTKLGSGKFSFARTCRLRVEFGDDVFMTGEGEQIAVLFRTAGDDPCALFKPELAPYADGFTQWGRDPLHNSPTNSPLTPGKFRGGTLVDEPLMLKTGRVPMNPGAAPEKGEPVIAVAYTPKLDAEEGFFCDFHLDPVDSESRAAALASPDPYMPFVHLGLARYQKHAVDALKLSHAVGRDVQLVPWRQGRIEFDGPRKFTLTLEGPIYGEGQPDTLPWIDVSLVHNERAPSPDYAWKPVEGGPSQHASELEPKFEKNGAGRWVWHGELPHSRAFFQYGLRIEEFERVYDQESKKVHVRGPVFSMTIDLWTGKGQ